MNALLEDVQQNITFALAEDLGEADLTADLIAPDAQAKAHVICRDEAVICGRPWFDAVFAHIEPTTTIHWFITEGDGVKADTRLCTLSGPARALLSGERAALNFLQTLSATATLTRRYAQAIAHTPTKVLDTRKTLPGLRRAQKYAVACGGGKNHRIGLFDAVLIKENHIMSAGSITQAVRSARRLHPQVTIEVETENLEEFREALAAQADIIMLDNYSLQDMRTAVELNQQTIKLEASGGVNLNSIAAIAETGVDYISVGALTKDIQAVDLSMRFEPS